MFYIRFNFRPINLFAYDFG